VLTLEFDYHLPARLIAQKPVEPRDASRLLILRRDSAALEHRHFHHILAYLRPGDLLVANVSRVIPARLHARKVPTGGKVEMLLLSRHGSRRWEALVKGRKVPVGQRLRLDGPDGDITLEATIEAVTPSGWRLLCFDQPLGAHLELFGVMPLPPYIHEPLEDPERYQTVYSRVDGSVAAPTAGLHFTHELMARTKELGVEWVSVLLHVGLDTFRPVSAELVQGHAMHTEYCHLSAEAARRINKAKAEGRRVIAVGTTSVRVLETAAQGATWGLEAWDARLTCSSTPGIGFAWSMP